MTEAAARPSPMGERCPACGETRWTQLFVARGYPISRCQGCDLVRTLGADFGGTVQYPPFDQQETAVMHLVRFGVGQLLRERVALVKGLQPQGRLLDFGCGSGSFARMAAKAGYDTVGVEPFSLGRPHDEPHLRLIRAPLAECGASLGTFDVITLWQVLEHVDQPGALLAELCTHLRPGGLLVVSVPNFASWQSRAFGPTWFHLDPPRHVTHFESATLRALLGKLDVDILHERTFHLEYGPVGWLQSALNGIVPRPNFLYELVKDRGALAGLPASTTALNLAVSVVAGTALAVPSLLVEALARAADAGAVLTVAARKRVGA